MNKGIAHEEVKSLLLENYGIKGEIRRLDGELDLNFMVLTEGQPEYLFKVTHFDASSAFLDFQVALLEHLSTQDLPSPAIIPTLQNESCGWFTDTSGQSRQFRLLTWMPGRLWSQVNPVTDHLRYSLGKVAGKLTRSLRGFAHTESYRSLEWDIAQGAWTEEHHGLFSGAQRKCIEYFQQMFREQAGAYRDLRKAVVHNDVNDNNIVVTQDIYNPEVYALIDFGDAVHTQIINDLAVCCVYAIMECNDPLAAAIPIIRGYHENFPLQEKELEQLYMAIGMRMVISLTKSAINKVAEPENAYLTISEGPLWILMEKWHAISADFAHFVFRSACGYDPHPNEKAFRDWVAEKEMSIEMLFPNAGKKRILPLDLSIAGNWLGLKEDYDDPEYFDFRIHQLQRKDPEAIIAGGYLEPRPIYTTGEYVKQGNHGREYRTLHLGVDFWLPAGTPVHAIIEGEVVTACNDAGDKEYGGLIILKHQGAGFEFFTLYGHLSLESIERMRIGDRIERGGVIGYLGNYPENGNWAPHLHFHVMLSLLDYTIDFPGVAYPDQKAIWQSICPDPNGFLKLKELKSQPRFTRENLWSYRKEHLGKGMSLQYQEPLEIVRGNGVYLMDREGRQYLDTVNNVAHLGHEHPEAVRAGQEQMAVLNTNTRYLNEHINSLAESLLDTLPEELTVLHFVNSGSEANELALRMIEAATGSRHMLVSEIGYHGNTNRCIEVSSYKFDGKGGKGAPEHTHVFPLPDVFRGKYRGKEAVSGYIEEVSRLLGDLDKNDIQLGGLILEPIISCGGQVELPTGFLPEVYHMVRKRGGLCISDEVQTGCGRVGDHFWGFQLHGVVPDIVTIGKPLGNGHPVAAVACTAEVAEKFANGMEFFNTFGGNPVSCAIAKKVIGIVQRDGLQNHAGEVGNYLKQQLKELQKRFPILGDIRGKGLFLGIELVDKELQPLSGHATYLVNRMKDYKILMSTDGADHNVIKIKPPMVFDKGNADEVLYYLEKILKEDPMKIE
ncbi:aminotransferase class III-fold pyridoxal phosphate-dependent enzyme [Robertkochia flava]|uniref:aminotransferase class III-fold pyridoxal phosphate-dependent enzyme n=1 Tax=Robertkochia flava TaxID=3447986 RepID=UPI001CCA3984|nr:aminotransferase class III-fold pyridoxal phosphate-dependent enzyme [Robertkochia marina]